MIEPTARLTPPETKDHTSVARVIDDWYVVCESSELSTTPLARTLLGVPLAIFRGADGSPGAVLDRCPHRNAPLSAGRVNEQHIECSYHGWQFDRGGECVVIPGLCGSPGTKGRRVASYPARDQDGFIWVYATPDTMPVREPFRFPHLGDPRYTHVRTTIDMEGTLHATAENALDVPHTAFLHRGLFRKPTERNEIDAVIRRWHDRAECEYIGEPRPSGLIGRVLAPGGGTVTHFDRFCLPCIAQVDYSIGDESHVCATTALTPISDFFTRLYGVVSFRLPFAVPGRLLAPILRPLGLQILKQDARMLRLQTETIRRFGGEQYVSTEIDTLGPHILRLLRNAERGDRIPLEKPIEKRVRMLA